MLLPVASKLQRQSTFGVSCTIVLQTPVVAIFFILHFVDNPSFILPIYFRFRSFSLTLFLSPSLPFSSLSTMATFTVTSKQTNPFEGQKPGTSGLRKKVLTPFTVRTVCVMLLISSIRPFASVSN
jgi:hypothetical protein